MKRTTGCLWLLALASSPGAASAQDLRVELGLRGGAATPVHGTVRAERSTGPMGALSVALRLPHGIAPRIELGYRYLNAADDDGRAHSGGLAHALLGARWYPPIAGRLRPFAGVQVGALLAFGGGGTTEGAPPGRTVQNARSSTVALGGALGVELSLHRRLSLDLEGRYDWMPEDAPEQYYPPVPGGGLLGVTLGLTFGL